jgi:hypothetical protein
MDDTYLTPTKGAKWAISRFVDGRWISLHQDSWLFDARDAGAILRALAIPASIENLDLYFPEREGMGRCPTLELMELCNVLDPTNPHIQNRKEHGV